MATVISSPDLQAMQDDLASAEFRIGAAEGFWDVLEPVETTWPYLVVWVNSACRESAPGRFHFRFECTNYPTQSPTGNFWDPEHQNPLAIDKRPKGRGRVAIVFRTDWENGSALYHPFDRQASQSHSNWSSKYPNLVWTRVHSITDLLSVLHDLLNCGEYTGV